MSRNQDGTQQAGGTDAGVSDPIDEAIKETEPQGQPMIGTTVVIASTGRAAQVMVPVGITVGEMAELQKWMWDTLYPAAQQVGPQGERPVAVLDTPRGPVAVKRN